MNKSNAIIKNPVLIAIGGFPGSGKTTIAQKLSVELGFPRLNSDSIGQLIRNSFNKNPTDLDPSWIAFDTLFFLCKEYIKHGSSVILDITLGWEFHWREIDRIIELYPQCSFLPIILDCEHALCLERIKNRIEKKTEDYQKGLEYFKKKKVVNIWTYLKSLDRKDAHFVDANDEIGRVYERVKYHLDQHLEVV